MSNSTDVSFGDRLAKAHKLKALIDSLDNYNPANPDISKENFGGFLKTLSNTSKTVTNNNHQLASAQQTRRELFHGEEGLKKRGAKVRDFIGSLKNGKDSIAYAKVQKELQKISNRKPATPSGESNTIEESKRSTQSAQTSFGSLLECGKSIVELVKTVPEYTPGNEHITTPNLEAFLTQLENANSAVNACLVATTQAIKKRQDLYEGEEGLRVRFQQIKNYLAAEYGKDSVVYQQALAIRY